MNEQTVRQQLHTFIVNELMRDPHYELSDSESIISSGLIDSFSLAQISVFIEREFGVYIPDPDLTVAKMDTLSQMVLRIMRDIK